MSIYWDKWVLVIVIVLVKSDEERRKTCVKFLKKLKTILYIWTQVSSLQADVLQLAISFKYLEQQANTKSRNYTVENLVVYRRKIISIVQRTFFYLGMLRETERTRECLICCVKFFTQTERESIERWIRIRKWRCERNQSGSNSGGGNNIAKLLA